MEEADGGGEGRKKGKSFCFFAGEKTFKKKKRKKIQQLIKQNRSWLNRIECGKAGRANATEKILRSAARVHASGEN